MAIHHGSYTFRGDNNSWRDPETPSRSQLIGTMDLRIPQGGRYLHEAGTAPVLTAAALLVAAGGGALTQTGRTRRRHRMSRHTAPRTRSVVRPWLSPPLRAAAVATAIAGLVGLALGVAAWTGPAHTTAVTTRPVSRSMVFSYTASVRRSPAYDGTTVASPAPVFRALTDAVDVADMETLARSATRYGLVILHWTRAGIDTFIVRDEATTYRYRTGAALAA